MAAALFVAGTHRTAAQAPPGDRPPLGSHITAAPMADLPSSADLFSLFDAAVPEVIADRIDTGGLSTGDPARTGAHGSSWTQTLFRIGDASITDPVGSGTPLLLPRVDAWERVDVMTGLMPIDVDAPGLAVVLTPRRPAERWLRVLDLAGTIPGLNAGTVGAFPVPIARLHAWADANLLASGPIDGPSVGLLVTTTATRSSRFERGRVNKLDANLASSFAHLQIAPGAGTPTGASHRISIVGWLQRARYPLLNRIPFDQSAAGEQARAIHSQAAWDFRSARGGSSSVYSSVTFADRRSDAAPAPVLLMERLRDGPPPELVNPGTGGSSVWSIGGRFRSPTVGTSSLRQQFVAGMDVEGDAARVSAAFKGLVGETLNGIPAHVWQFTAPESPSRWRSTIVSAYASDHIEMRSRTSLDAGLRYENITGRNSTGAAVISWPNLMPRAQLRVALTDFAHIAAFGGYGRYGHRLTLGTLAWGDPTAPVGRMFLWTTSDGTRPPLPSEIGAYIARIGPGAGGDPSFTSIDPGLRRPHMDEIVTGFEARPTDRSFVRVSAIGRREHDLFGAQDVGVPESTYAVSFIPDKGVDLAGSQDDQLLPIYNRARSTFGADRYVVANRFDHESSFVGADLTYQTQTDHLFLLMGVTAGRSEALSASRGFNAIENDQSVIGEVFIDPNARTYAQGRMFTERGYTLKWSGAYRFPRDATFGVVARYQDGQHFARLVIVPNLNQGPEAIRAFRNGRTRFTYTLTIDLRLQKQFTIGGCRLTGLVDAFNVLNKAKEVEEFPVTGPLSRLTAAVQPPRAIHVGARLSF